MRAGRHCAFPEGAETRGGGWRCVGGCASGTGHCWSPTHRSWWRATFTRGTHGQQENRQRQRQRQRQQYGALCPPRSLLVLRSGSTLRYSQRVCN